MLRLYKLLHVVGVLKEVVGEQTKVTLAADHRTTDHLVHQSAADEVILVVADSTSVLFYHRANLSRLFSVLYVSEHETVEGYILSAAFVMIERMNFQNGVDSDAVAKKQKTSCDYDENHSTHDGCHHYRRRSNNGIDAEILVVDYPLSPEP